MANPGSEPRSLHPYPDGTSDAAKILDAAGAVQYAAMSVDNLWMKDRLLGLAGELFCEVAVLRGEPRPMERRAATADTDGE